MAPMSWWVPASGGLAQGELLPGCLVPVVSERFGLETQDIDVADADLIVITQSCDLANLKATAVSLCRYYSLTEFETINPSYAKKGVWEEVRRGRREGLYMLASPTAPADNRAALVVDFRQIFSLPYACLANHAAARGDRWRLLPPYLEHFSQAFARFFMRVGLPAAVPAFA